MRRSRAFCSAPLVPLFVLAVVVFAVVCEASSLGTSARHAQVKHGDARVARAAACQAGFVFVLKQSRCVPCPSGTYRAPSAPNFCVPCPAGTFQPVWGATSRSLCRACYPGTFAPKTGSPVCALCSARTSSGFGASSCVRCAPGFAISFRGATCQRCAAGEYSDTPNSPRCKQCLYGVVDRGGTRCRACMKGDACYACPRAMYRPVGGECAYCPLGTEVPPSSAMVGTSISDCKPCKKGYARGVWDPQCVKCQPGSTAVAEGATACRRASSSKNNNSSGPYSNECPSDAFVNVRGVCQSCEAGSRRDLKKNLCVPCGAGRASLGGKSTACWTCPQGTKVTKDGDACTCGDGSFLRAGKCMKCRAGSFRSDETHRPYGCEECPPGHVSAAGSAVCTRCPYGTVADRNHIKCVRCRPGFVPNLLTEIDLYYEYGHSRCVNGRTGRFVTGSTR